MLKKIHINTIKQIVIESSYVIMDIYQKNFLIDYKNDNSPLTEADLMSNQIICNSLKKLYPDIPIISEENKQVEYIERKYWEYFWCVDPLDGTKEFLKKNGEFTINIALVHKNTPVLGVVFAPSIGKLYYAKKGEGAYCNGRKLPILSKNNFTVVTSKSHLSEKTLKFVNDLKNKYQNLELISKGSSLKICMIAEGIANIYPRIGPTMEWDTAAADAIIRESGKMIYQYDSSISALDYLSKNINLKPLVYNKEKLLNPSFVVV